MPFDAAMNMYPKSLNCNNSTSISLPMNTGIIPFSCPRMFSDVSDENEKQKVETVNLLTGTCESREKVDISFKIFTPSTYLDKDIPEFKICEENDFTSGTIL